MIHIFFKKRIFDRYSLFKLSYVKHVIDIEAMHIFLPSRQIDNYNIKALYFVKITNTHTHML